MALRMLCKLYCGCTRHLEAATMHGHLERAGNSNGRDEGLEGRGQAEGHWTISIQFTCE